MTSMHPRIRLPHPSRRRKNRAGTQIDPHHLGAHITETGVAFSVYAHQATP
ncbi:hypothetical protein [Mobiluncus mulieris]|uniref:hypothetical protein n=1 Tax=Mobiluncus mulieris TaxID=2052 RepID=UPI002093A944|nr:hypothetical protein [Mobiluncus mulieris]